MYHRYYCNSKLRFEGPVTTVFPFIRVRITRVPIPSRPSFNQETLFISRGIFLTIFLVKTYPNRRPVLLPGDPQPFHPGFLSTTGVSRGFNGTHTTRNEYSLTSCVPCVSGFLISLHLYSRRDGRCCRGKVSVSGVGRTLVSRRSKDHYVLFFGVFW